MTIEDINEEFGNLDCLDAEDLRDFVKLVVNDSDLVERRMFPGKSQDMRTDNVRSSGNIEAAIERETICDGIYQNLPDWAKW